MTPDYTNWLQEVHNRFQALFNEPLPQLNGDDIAHYRSLIARLDAAVFSGFHLIHSRTVAAIQSQRTEPHKSTVTLDDLGL